MEKQRQAALAAMVEWLSDAHELGKAPAKIECAGEFDLHGMHYYLFKYKKSALGKWLLGVCGGYEEGGTEHCGHVFSEMEEYDPATALEKARAMVEMIREYWMKRAEEEMRRRGIEPDGDECGCGHDECGCGHDECGCGHDECGCGHGDCNCGHDHDDSDGTGPFVGFILLDENEWDPEQLKRDLEDDWGIRYTEDAESGETDAAVLVFEVDGMMAAISLMPAPVPDGEAEHNAQNNYLWPEAVQTAKAHKAHIMAAVLGHDRSPLEIGQLYVKICASCLRQKHATAIYTSGTVFQPEFYIQGALTMNEGDLPVFNWIYFGLYQTDGGINGYTYGMTAFGKEELEVLGSAASPREVRDFLFDIAYYILAEDVTLHDGETIGFSAEQKLPITRSEGVSVDGQSIKIAF